MKWIYVEGKFIPVQNCVKIDFTYSEIDRECAVMIIVEDVNGNSTKSIYHSKRDKLSDDFIRNKFQDFIIDSTITLFDFYKTCKMIEVYNS